MSKAIIIILILLAIIVIYFITGYNGFIKLRNSVEEAFSTMDVYLKKRFDLIPNLVETVKGYAAHEKSTLENVTEARTAVMNSATDSEPPGWPDWAFQIIETMFFLRSTHLFFSSGMLRFSFIWQLSFQIQAVKIVEIPGI